MAGDDHHIGRIDLVAAISDADAAQSLRRRIETLGWTLFPPVIEALLDRLAPRDLHLEIPALELDLGSVSAEHLEVEALDALKRSLAEALGGAIARARQALPPERQRLSRAMAALARVETFLLGGILPFADPSRPFDLTDLLRQLAADAPDALAAMLRRHARSRHFLERLVLQAGGEGMGLLLHLLAPADADVILALIADIVLVHREAALPALRAVSEPRLIEMAWVVTLEFLLADAGSQFNRRRFLAALIRREGRQFGIAYDDLLDLLARAVAATAQHAALKSSLPTTLAELLAERKRPASSPDAGDASGPPRADDRPWTDGPATDADHGQRAPLALDRLARTLPPARFAALVRALAPGSAGNIQADMALLANALAEAGERDDSLARDILRLRAMMLAYLLRRPSGRFDRRAMWRQVLPALTGGRAARIADALHKRGEAARLLLGLLMAEPQTARPSARSARASSREPGAAARLERLLPLLRAGARAAELAPMVAPLSPADFAALLAERLPMASARLLADVEALIARHAATPLLALDKAAFATLVRLSIAEHLAAGSVAPSRRALWRAVLADLAREAGQRHSAFVGQLRADGNASRVMAQPDADRDARRRRVAHYLRAGPSVAAGSDLPSILRGDGAGLSAAIAEALGQGRASSETVAERLLDWLLPTEILALLAPGQAARILREAVPPPGGDRDHWRALIAALLHGEALAPEAVRAGPAHAAAHADRRAALDDWLGGDGPQPPPATLAALPGSDIAMLTALLLRDTPEQTLDRLTLAHGSLSPAAAHAMLARLAPWAMQPDGPLASLAAGLAPPEREALMLRAVAMSLGGRTLDLAALAQRPVPSPSPPPPERRTPADRGTVRADGAAGPPDRARLLAWLDGAAADAAEAARLSTLFAQLADADDPALLAFIAARRGQPRAHARWAAQLSEPAFARLLQVTSPGGARGLLDGLTLLTAAWRQVAPFGAPRPPLSMLRAMLLDQSGPPHDISIPAIFERLIATLVGGDARAADDVRARAGQLAGRGGYVTVATALRRIAPAQPRPRASPAPAPDKAAKAGRPRAPAETPGETHYVTNAGLVLLNPYLPMLFERLGLLADVDGRPAIPPGEPLSRAVHLLDYIARGRLDAPEPELLLNKLLCGAPFAMPVARALAPDPADLATCDALIEAMLANWPILSDGTPAALRETFFQREGRLVRGSGQWMLTVQRKTLDVLIDQVPWSFALVYHRWMSDPIHVTW